MKRPDQHEIDAQARRMLQGILPKYLVYREQGDDYGVDAEIEVFKDQESTGLIYKLQIKGTDSPSYLKQSPHISFNLEIDRADYLINQVKIPAAIVLCDLENKRIFWHPIQLDASTLDAFRNATNAKQSSFNIRFSQENSLPDTFTNLLEALAKSGNKIALDLCSSISAHQYKQYVDGAENLDKEILKLREKIEIAGSVKIIQMINSGDLTGARIKIDAVLTNQESTTSAKFDSFLKLESIFAMEIIGKPNAETKLIEFTQQHTQRLVELTKEAEPFYQLLAKAFVLASDLRVQCKEDFDLYTNWTHHNQLQSSKSVGFESIWHLLLPNYRSVANNRILESLIEVSDLLKTASDNRYWVAYVFIVERVFNSMGSFFKRIQFEKAMDRYAPIFQWMEECIETAIMVVDSFQIEEARDSFLSSFASVFLLLANAFDEEDCKRREKKSIELVSKIKDDNFRARKMNSITKFYAQMRESIVSDPSTPYDIEVIRQHFIAQAHSLKILKPENEETPEDKQNRRIFEIGLRDLDPTDHLIHCQHLFVEYLGAMGIPAKILGMYTAGMKHLGCVKHLEHGLIGSWEIGGAYQLFREKHCNQCKDTLPHPPQWKHNSKWETEMRGQVMQERRRLNVKRPFERN